MLSRGRSLRLCLSLPLSEGRSQVGCGPLGSGGSLGLCPPEAPCQLRASVPHLCAQVRQGGRLPEGPHLGASRLPLSSQVPCLSWRRPVLRSSAAPSCSTWCAVHCSVSCTGLPAAMLSRCAWLD